ncbi:MAG TPA: hypothetical protein VN764_11855, partial [Polyangiaceae bacterium]|nr:hypothetical protein [Polyangiaceae bacterium]
MVDSYNALVTKAEELEAQLPENMKDAYYQLVLHPILACANLNEMYVSQAKNQRFAGQGRASTNTMADRVGDLYENDTTITNRYHSIAGGKWNHMMKQTHIGYTSWDNPEVQVRPSTQTIQASGAASIGASIEGSTQGLTPASGAATLPELSVYYPQEVRHLEIYNRGAGSFDFTAASDQAYVTVEPNTGTVGDDVTLKVSVDWAQVPEGDSDALITVSGEGGDIDVVLPLRKPSTPTPTEVVGFVENAGYVSVDASHYTDKVEQAGVAWSTIPDLGRTGSAVHIQPDTAAAVTAGGDTPQLHYKMYFFEPGQVEVRVYLSPSLPVLGQHYRYAVSFDDQAPQTVDIHQGLPSDFNDTAPIW